VSGATSVLHHQCRHFKYCHFRTTVTAATKNTAVLTGYFHTAGYFHTRDTFTRHFLYRGNRPTATTCLADPPPGSPTFSLAALPPRYRSRFTAKAQNSNRDSRKSEIGNPASA